jgi:hypothetical protein
VLMRLPALQAPPLGRGGESFAVLACSTPPPQMLSTPVIQRDFITSAAMASAPLARGSRARKSAAAFVQGAAQSRPKVQGFLERNLFGLVCCTMTYEVYKTSYKLYSRYLPAEYFY